MKLAVLTFMLACAPHAPATQAPIASGATEHGTTQTTTTTTTVAPGPVPEKRPAPEPAPPPPTLDARCPAQSPKIGAACRPEGLACNYGVLYVCNVRRWEARFSK